MVVLLPDTRHELARNSGVNVLSIPVENVQELLNIITPENVIGGGREAIVVGGFAIDNITGELRFAGENDVQQVVKFYYTNHPMSNLIVDLALRNCEKIDDYGRSRLRELELGVDHSEGMYAPFNRIQSHIAAYNKAPNLVVPLTAALRVEDSSLFGIMKPFVPPNRGRSWGELTPAQQKSLKPLAKYLDKKGMGNFVVLDDGGVQVIDVGNIY